MGKKKTTETTTKANGNGHAKNGAASKEAWKAAASASAAQAAADGKVDGAPTSGPPPKPKKPPTPERVVRSREIELTQDELRKAAISWRAADEKRTQADAVFEAAKAAHKAAVGEIEQTQRTACQAIASGKKRVEITAEWRPNFRTLSMELTDVDTNKVLTDPETSTPEIRAMTASERQTWLPFGGEQPTAAETVIREPTRKETPVAEV